MQKSLCAICRCFSSIFLTNCPMVDSQLADVVTATQYCRFVTACCHSYFYFLCICFQTDPYALEATVLTALNYGVLSDCKLFHLWFLKQHTSSQTPAVSDCVPRHFGEVTRVNHLFCIGKIFQPSHLTCGSSLPFGHSN